MFGLTPFIKRVSHSGQSVGFRSNNGSNLGSTSILILEPQHCHLKMRIKHDGGVIIMQAHSFSTGSGYSVTGM